MLPTLWKWGKSHLLTELAAIIGCVVHYQPTHYSEKRSKLVLLYIQEQTVIRDGYWWGFLCLKYYRAARFRMRCVTIVLVERRCTDCKNKWSSLLENNVYLQRLNGITLCVIFVYAMPLAGTQNSERVKCIEFKLQLCVRPNRTVKCSYKTWH